MIEKQTKPINHAEREVETLESVLEDWSLNADEIRACHAIALQIEDVKRRLSSPLFRQAKNMLRKQRDQLYKQFKAYDYDTRYAVYGAVPVAVREAIPYSTCWLHAFDPLQYP